MPKKNFLFYAMLLSLPAIADDAPILVEARKVASSMPPKLMAVLQEEIAKGGAENAIPVCREQAPVLAKQVSTDTGWKIRRVSLKVRNDQRATPDSWERSVLEEFDRRVAAGESPARLETWREDVASDGRKEFRYMKALPTQKMCLECHGPNDSIKSTVKSKLTELYPHDLATGYAEGQIRGAISIRKPL